MNYVGGGGGGMLLTVITHQWHHVASTNYIRIGLGISEIARGGKMGYKTERDNAGRCYSRHDMPSFCPQHRALGGHNITLSRIWKNHRQRLP